MGTSSTFITLALLSTLIHVGADSWRGIKPLHSSRTDVERIFGAAGSECKCTYDSEEFNVFVVYSSGTCNSAESNGWNVPPDTVIRFTVYPKNRPKLSALKIDKRKYKVTEDQELPGVFYYINEEEGIGFSVENDVVNSFFYIPSIKDNKMHC